MFNLSAVSVQSETTLLFISSDAGVQPLTTRLLKSSAICRLRNVSQIHQWASSQRVEVFLREYFEIRNIPCYYWLLCLLKLIIPESFNRCFIRWVQSFLPDGAKELTLSFDGKTIRSTGKMDKYENPLHIVSAQIADTEINFIRGDSKNLFPLELFFNLTNNERCNKIKT